MVEDFNSYTENHPTIFAKLGNHSFLLEKCKDPIKGLSNRDDINGHNGMIFYLNPDMEHSFHMKDCLLPLDIIFINGNIIEKIYSNCKPCKLYNCKKYTYPNYNIVIEILGGVSKTLGILPNDIVIF